MGLTSRLTLAWRLTLFRSYTVLHTASRQCQLDPHWEADPLPWKPVCNQYVWNQVQMNSYLYLMWNNISVFIWSTFSELNNIKLYWDFHHITTVFQSLNSGINRWKYFYWEAIQQYIDNVSRGLLSITHKDVLTYSISIILVVRWRIHTFCIKLTAEKDWIQFYDTFLHNAT